MQKIIRSIALVFLICLYFYTNIKGQDIQYHFTPEKKIIQKASYIIHDKLGNLYVIANNQLIKYTSLLNPEKTYSNPYVGKISSVDVTNPLKIIVYYQDFNQVNFLDNTLSPSGDPLALTELGFQYTTLVCTSYDNGLWLYESQNFQLIRLDNKLSTTFKSGNLSMLLGFEINPDFMVESGNFLYLNDPQKGIMVFDRFGTYFKTIPVLSIHSFQIIGLNLYYMKGNTFFIYNLKTNDISKIIVPDNNPVSISIFYGLKQTKMCILSKTEINSYILE